MPTTVIGGITFEGDGSQEYPLLVSTYEELKTSIEQTQGSDTSYIKLINNIDGNDYELGTTFNIYKRLPGHPIDLDLAGFAIQNWYIAGAQNVTGASPNYCLFYISGDLYMHDGRILNIFGHYTQDFTSSCVIFTAGTYTAPTYHIPKFENISFSMDISKCAFALADSSTTNGSLRGIYTNCSFYIQSSTPLGNKGLLDNSAHSVFNNSAGPLFNSCDFKFHNLNVACVNSVESAAIGPTPASSNNYSKQINQCRFQGSITIKDQPGVTISLDRRLIIFYYMLFNNCVFNMHMINEVSDTESGKHLTVTTHVNSSINRLNLMNIDYLDEVALPGGTLHGIVQAHTNQMDMRENPQADEVLNNDLHWDVQKG